MQKPISVNLGQQSTLARLLAQENINVIHGNYRTAWFNPEQRTLALPVWKDRGKAVYDLLTGHEVGHALYTPAKGWHDAVDDILGAPKAYLNVLEDVRIERKVQDKYPGLRFQFKKAYKQLAEEDFFGLSKVQDIQNLIIIDRINLKTKLGEFVECEFVNSVEQDFYARSFQTETFEDVVALAKEIYAYQKSLMKESKQKEMPNIPTLDMPELPPEQGDQGSADDYNKPDPSEEPPKGEGEEVEEKTEEGSEEVDGNQREGQTKPDDVEQKELDSAEGIDKPAPKKKDEDEAFLDSVTDKAFRAMEESLTSTDELKGIMVYTLNSIKEKDIVIDYKEYYKQWKADISPARLSTYGVELIELGLEKNLEKFKKFKNETELAGAYMAKEFELRKAAYQYSRSSVHKTGLINTNKLHAYKYSEDIFLKSTRLANYKNHGMMMFIDFSGSMAENMGATIRQLLNLTTFCRMINVPYEVYAFTTRVRDEKEETDIQWDDFADCEIIPEKFNLLNLMSSRMTRKEYTEGFRMLWNLSMAWDSQLSQIYINRWNHLHSTPLNTTIVYANEMIKDYKKKHNIEKMTAMFLTDGESDSFQIRMTEEGAEKRIASPGSFYGYRGRKAIVRVDGQSMKVASVNSADMTTQLLKFLKKSTDSNVLGFFISQYRNQAINKAVSEAPHTSISKYRDKYTQQMTKNRCLIEDNIFGYDRYFGLCTKYMDIVENEFGELVEDGATKNKIKTAFAKASKSKRVNRILLNAFVDAIA
jgi:hypothetical protein